MKLKNLLIIFIFLMIILVIPVKAASFKISASTSKVKPNATFTINVGGDCIGRVNLSVSNGKLSKSSVWVEQNTESITVTAGNSGVVTITATPTAGFSDADANEYNPGSRSVSVSIIEESSTPSNPTTPSNPGSSTSKPSTSTSQKPQDKRSSNNKLKNLKVEGYELNPKFDPNTEKYTLNLPNTVTSIDISGVAEDDKAKVSGVGKTELKPGNNEIKITVTAENGSKKTYKLNVFVDEAPTVFINYNDESIGLVRNLEGLNIPEGFKKEDITKDDKTITVFTNDKISIIYGVTNNIKNLYLYNKEKNEITNKLIPIKIANKTIYLLDTKNDDDNLELSQLKIEDLEIDCYKYKNQDNYYLLNTINADGTRVEYLYEASENSLIPYPTFLSNCPTNESTKHNNNLLIIILSCLSGALLIIILALLKKQKGSKTYEKTV